MQQTIQNKIKQIVASAVDDKSIFGVSVVIKQQDEIVTYHEGNFSDDDRYFIASTTKLFTSAVIYQLCDEGKLSLSDTLSKYFDNDTIKGLHTKDGVDHTAEITIAQLLAHTSGIPDYFLQKRDGTTLYDEVIKGGDTSWNLEVVLARIKSMPAKFVPGKKGKAYYSDTNYQLLGAIIESIEGEPVSTVYMKRIFQPLEMVDTYMYEGKDDSKLKEMYYKSSKLRIPRAMQSFGADGAAVSTSRDMAVFVEAFFEGKLFAIQHIAEGAIYNRIFFPLEYGVGFMRLKLPRIMSPLKALPELVGHSGHSGAFAFYDRSRHVAICGTVNQIDNPSLSFKLLIKINNAL